MNLKDNGPGRVRGHERDGSFSFTIIHIFKERFSFQPNKEAYLFLNDELNVVQSLTYNELNDLVVQYASNIESCTTKGDRVLVALPQNLNYVVAVLGIIYSGRIAVPLYPPKNENQFNTIFNVARDCEAKAIISDSNIKSKVLGSFRYFEDLNWVLIDQLAQNLVNISFPEPNLNDIAFLQYTSGSTSNPKGVMINHENLMSNLVMIQEAFKYTENCDFLGWLPLFHDMGLIGNLFLPLFLGSKSYLMSPSEFISNPLNWMRAISKYRIAASGGPDFAFRLCKDRIKNTSDLNLDLSCWRTAYCGSEPINARTLDSFYNATKGYGFSKNSLCPTYGLAEATLFVSGGESKEYTTHFLDAMQYKAGRVSYTNKNAEDTVNLVSCGKSDWLGQKIICIDERGNEVADRNTIGEICISGKNVSKGYWGKSTDSNIKIHGNKNNYLRTGDLGFISENSELVISGRSCDMIIKSGNNFFPQEIEYSVENKFDEVMSHGTALFQEFLSENNKITFVIEIKRKSLRSFNHIKLGAAINAAVLSEYGFEIDEIYFAKPGQILRTSSGKIRRAATKKSLQLSVFNFLAFWNKTKENEINIFEYSEHRDIEVLVLEILQKVLQIVELSTHTRLLDLSLDSLTITQFFSQIEEKTGIELSYADLYEEITVEDIIKLIFLRVTYNISGISMVNKKSVTAKNQDMWLKMENRPLLNLISCNLIPKVDAASIAYLPSEVTLKMSKEDIKKDVFFDTPFIMSVLSFSFGRVAVIVIPVFSDELFTSSNKEILKQLNRAMEMASFIGAKTVSFTGLLPSSTQYLNISELHKKAKGKNLKITTGHATTVASVILYIEKLMHNHKRKLTEEVVGFLGVGSIGEATLHLMLSSFAHPKKIILCDLIIKKNHLDLLEKYIFRTYNYKGEICKNFIIGTETPNNDFYESTLIIGATSVPNALDITKLKSNTMIIDDSSPHCFDVSAFKKRYNLDQDVVATEGGILNNFEEIHEIRYTSTELKKIENLLPSIHIKRKANEVTSCILSSLLTEKYNVGCTVGKVKLEQSIEHLKLVRKLNIGASEFHLEGQQLGAISKHVKVKV